jgi:hypothetical protein
MDNLPSLFHQATPIGTSMPQTNQNGLDWPIELLPNGIADSMEAAFDYQEIQELFKDLPDPTTGPAVNPPASPNIVGQPPSAATTNKVDVMPSLAINDVEYRRKRAERQRNLRDRRRQEQAQVQKQIAATASDIKAAHVEQDSLLAENTVLRKVADYWKDSFQAAQSLVSSTVGKVKTDYQYAVEGLAWIGLQVYSPTDAQFHAFLDRKTTDELSSLGEKITERTACLFSQWLADPNARENIEAQLKKIGEMRLRCMNYLLATRPEVAIELFRQRLMPTGPHGEPNPTLVEVVTSVKFTPQQLEGLEREWSLYLQRTESVRQATRSMISFLTSTAAEESLESLCSMGVAGLFSERLQAARKLEAHPASEAHAFVKLTKWFSDHFTTEQKLTLMDGCAPYYPDCIQICRHLFGDTHGKAIAGTGRVQSVDIG